MASFIIRFQTQWEDSSQDEILLFSFRDETHVLKAAFAVDYRETPVKRLYKL